MRWFILLLLAPALWGYDLSLALKAQADFDRVKMAPIPRLPDALACAQSQAAMLPVMLPKELPLIHFRKGYCVLIAGVLRKNRSDFDEAAKEFDRAIQAWPAQGTEPVLPGLHIFAGVARLKTQPGQNEIPAIASDLASALDQPACPSGILPAGACGQLVDAGRLWLGWIYYRQNSLAEAAHLFQFLPKSGWDSWVAGRRAFEAQRGAESIPLFEKALQIWTTAARYPQSGIRALLGPQPDIPQAQQELGISQFLAGNYQEAIASFDASIKARPQNAYAIFLRGRAKDILGKNESALADYDLASRTAFADSPTALASGEAHYYRGIWLFRRKEYTRAEDEFASSLNFGPGPALRPDVSAWRHMTALKEGACESSAQYLRESLARVSGFFPREEAETLLERCGKRRESAAAAVCYSAG